MKKSLRLLWKIAEEKVIDFRHPPNLVLLGDLCVNCFQHPAINESFLSNQTKNSFQCIVFFFFFRKVQELDLVVIFLSIDRKQNVSADLAVNFAAAITCYINED